MPKLTFDVFCCVILYFASFLLIGEWVCWNIGSVNYKSQLSTVWSFDFLSKFTSTYFGLWLKRLHRDSLTMEINMVNFNVFTRHPVLRSSSRSSVNYVVSTGGTGVLFVKYPQLDFQPSHFFALGSPIAMFLTVRGVDTLGDEFRFPTCPSFFNIFHPVSYFLCFTNFIRFY